jgi:hypothetical protein
MPFLPACQHLPPVAKNIEDIGEDTALKIEVSREILKKETDLDICIKVQNKDESVRPVRPNK